jgi:HAMP domain-containing protein
LNPGVTVASSWLVIALELLLGAVIAFLAWKSWTWRRVRLEEHGTQLAEGIEQRTRELEAVVFLASC